MTFLDDRSIIEMNGIGQRADSFVLQLTDTARRWIGNLDVQRDGNPSVEVNTSNNLSIRRLANVTITNPPDIDTAACRVRPVMILQNGSRYPLGIFMFGDDIRHSLRSGAQWTPQLFDEGLLFNGDLGQTKTITPSTNDKTLLQLFAQIAGESLNPYGIPIDVSRAPDGHPTANLTFAAGTSRAAALQSIAAALGCLPPYFDNFGVFTLRPAPMLTTPASHTYSLGTRIIADSRSTTNSVYSAFNRYIVVGGTINGAPVVGVYDLPPSAPHSAAQTGQVTTKTVTISGITSQALANVAAYTQSIIDRTAYAKVSWSSLADPSHDAYDVCDVVGDRAVETGWTLPLAPGGDMTHQGTVLFS